MFTIYDKFTGEIKRVSELDDPAHWQGSLPGSFDSSTHYVKEGVAIPLPPKMNDEPVFDYLIDRWVQQAGLDTRAIISTRNRLLAASDWTQLPDVPLVTKELWVQYRQALRDITNQSGYPLDIIWPLEPSGSELVYEVESM